MGLKRMLVEGMKVRVDRPYSWKEFSDALVRQAVGDAVRSLPRQDGELVKLAYFGGMSNGEISTATGVPQATIERRLRRAIATIAQFVESGRGLGQRALGALVIWLSGRWFHESLLPAAQATVVAGMAAVMVAQPPATVPSSPGPPAAPAVTTATSVAPQAPALAPAATQPAQPADASSPAGVAAPAQVPVTNVPVPSVPLPITVPPLPPLPVPVKPPQL